MKKVLALVLALAMMLCCFTACGGNKDTGKTNDENVLKIGGIGPTTGGAALYGNAVKNGMQLAVDEINAAGGINGMKIEMNFQDDTHDAEKALNAYNNLKDWGMQILVGTVTSAPCIAVQAQAGTDGMFLLTPSGSALEAIEAATAFRVCFSDPNQGVASADYIAENGLSKKIAVIYNSSDAYSSGIYEKFASEAETKGLEIVAAESFTNDSNQDFSAQIQKIKTSGADLVFLPIYAQEASLVLQQANKAGLTTKFFGCDGLDGILNIENFDTKLAEGVMLLTPFAKDGKDEATKKFVAAYREKYNNDDTYLIQFAADAYDAVYIVKAAAEKAGIKGGMSVQEIGEALSAAMTQITVDGVTGTGIKWDESGEPSKSPKAVVITDGAYKSMD